MTIGKSLWKKMYIYKMKQNNNLSQCMTKGVFWHGKSIFFWLVGCIEDLRHFSGISAISRLGSRRISEIQMARPGIEPRTSCSASQELNHYTTAAPSWTSGNQRTICECRKVWCKVPVILVQEHDKVSSEIKNIDFARNITLLGKRYCRYLRSLRIGRDITPLRATDPETVTFNNNVVWYGN